MNQVLDNNILVGIEIDYDYKDADDSTVQDDDGIPDTDYPYKTEINESASIRGRVGYVFNNDQTLVYATGGYTMAKIDRKTYDIDYPADVSSDSKWNDGWTAGLGVEHFVTTNLSARIEYRYSEYSTEHLDASVAYGDGYLEKQDYDEDSLRIGIAYHF
ncbi:MAG: porin family protein [Cycloclasticus sp.]|nr:porin family protein [Cycloclasticus sp.]MBQ0789779.1 porin family protein [Cycloclasticus sp.]